ncbi:hypothetical protein GCM10022221_34440 [Actinocorallia aurea]
MAQTGPGRQPQKPSAGGWLVLGCGGFLGLLVLAGACGAVFDSGDAAPASVQQAAAPTATVTVTVTVTETVRPAKKPSTPKTRKPKTRRPKPKPKPTTPAAPSTDPHFGTCAEANAAGYGPYTQGTDPEYAWYTDRDHDGVACET